MKVLVNHDGNVSKLQINWVSACALDALTSMFKSTHCSLLYNWLFHNVLARVWGFNIDNSMLDLSSDWRTSTDGSWNTMHHPRIQWLTGTGWRGHTRHSLQYIRTYICKMMEHIFAFWSNMYQSGGFIMRQVRNILCTMTENIFTAHYPCRTHVYTKNIGKRRTWHWVPGLRYTHTYVLSAFCSITSMDCQWPSQCSHRHHRQRHQHYQHEHKDLFFFSLALIKCI